ncbi:MAG TPA: hypothetical protein VMU66_00435 [Gaiellales bacterium]|nr:hypothetical protein [Gaiellales bacterium]
MSTLVELTVVLIVCPALLAIWLDNRYPQLRPSEIRRTVVHLGVAGVIAFLLMKPLLLGVGALASGSLAGALAITLACTVITYTLTVSVWIMRWAARPT